MHHARGLQIAEGSAFRSRDWYILSRTTGYPELSSPLHPRDSRRLCRKTTKGSDLVVTLVAPSVNPRGASQRKAATGSNRGCSSSDDYVYEEDNEDAGVGGHGMEDDGGGVPSLRTIIDLWVSGFIRASLPV